MSDLKPLLMEIIDRAFARLADNPDLRAMARRCWPKEQCPSEGAARAQMASIVKRGLEKDGTRIHVYKCPECCYWHVGHGMIVKEGM